MKLLIRYRYTKQSSTVTSVPDNATLADKARAARKAAEAVAPKGAQVSLVEFVEQP